MRMNEIASNWSSPNKNDRLTNATFDRTPGDRQNQQKNVNVQRKVSLAQVFDQNQRLNLEIRKRQRSRKEAPRFGGSPRNGRAPIAIIQNQDRQNHIMSVQKGKFILLKNNSFAAIAKKMQGMGRLTNQEIQFVKFGLLASFQARQSKTRAYQKIVRQEGSSRPFGFEKVKLGIKGTLQPHPKLKMIWSKLIQDFTYLTKTNELNGYYILYDILIQTQYYKKIYANFPNGALKDIQYKIQQKQIDEYIIPNTNPKVDVDYIFYKQFLQQMIIKYYNQYNGFFDIIKIILQGDKNVRVQIKYRDLQEHGIIKELWEFGWLKFACGNIAQDFQNHLTANQIKNHNFYNQTNQFKIQLFFDFAYLFIHLIQSKHTQQKLMNMRHLNLVQIIKFINNDINLVCKYRILTPRKQIELKQISLKLLLVLIPFGSLIRTPSILNYFQQNPIARDYYANQRNNKEEMLQALTYLEDQIFTVLKTFGQCELECLRKMNGADTWDVKIWLNVIQNKKWNVNTLQWKYFFALFMQKVNPKDIRGQPFLLSLVIYLSKRILTGRTKEFKDLWDQIVSYQSNRQNLSNVDKSEMIARFKINQMQLYFIGNFLRSRLKDKDYIQPLKVISRMLKVQASKQAQSNLSLLNFVKSSFPGDSNFILTIINTIRFCFNMYPNYLVHQIFVTPIKGKSSFFTPSHSMYSHSINFTAEYDMKCFCELVKSNIQDLTPIQKYIFLVSKQTQSEVQLPGFKTCIFLTQVFRLIDQKLVYQMKTLRYVMLAMNQLFTYQGTRKYLLFAWSVYFSERSSISMPKLRNMIAFISITDGRNQQQCRQLPKLRLAFKHHLLCLLKYCDSLDEIFPIESYEVSNLYTKIQIELSQYKYQSSYQYIRSRYQLRVTDWLKQFVRIIGAGTIQAVDFQCIDLILHKLRTKYDRSQTFRIMERVLQHLNSVDWTTHIIDSIRPSISLSNNKLVLQNLNMKLVLQSPVQLQQNSYKYNKYSDQKYVQFKNYKLKQHEEIDVLRKLYMVLKVIKTILQLKLQLQEQQKRQEQFSCQPYYLIYKLDFFWQIIAKLTNPQKMHYYEFLHKKQISHKSKVNILMSIVDYLNINIRHPKARYIQNSPKNMFYGRKFTNFKEFTHYLQYQQCYQQALRDINNVNIQFFYTILYQSQSFSYSGDSTFKGMIIDIITLLIQNKSGQLLFKCLDDPLYPQIRKVNRKIQNYPRLEMKINNYSRKQLLMSNLLQRFKGSNHFTRIVVKSKVLNCLISIIQCHQLSNLILDNIEQWKQAFLIYLRAFNPQKVRKSNFVEHVYVLNRIAFLIYKIISVSTDISNYSEWLCWLLGSRDQLLYRIFNLMKDIQQHFNDIDRTKQTFSSSPLDNYNIQKKLIQNIIYRSTYHILLNIVEQIFTILPKKQIIKFLRFMVINHKIFIQNPIQIKQKPQLLSQLHINLNNSLPKFIKHPSGNHWTTKFNNQLLQSRNLSPYKANRFGKNYLYNTFQFYQKLLFARRQTLKRGQDYVGGVFSNQITYMRQNVYFIQFYNCQISLEHVCILLSYTYLNLMNMVMNIGYQGLILSNQNLDKLIPLKYHSQLINLQQKQLCHNEFTVQSFIEQLPQRAFLKSTFTMIEQLIQHLLKQISPFPANYKMNKNKKQLLRRYQNKQGQSQLMFIESMQKEIILCTNTDQVILLMGRLNTQCSKQLKQSFDLQHANLFMIDLNKQLQMLAQFKLKASLEVILITFQSLAKNVCQMFQLLNTYFNTHQELPVKLSDFQFEPKQYKSAKYINCMKIKQIKEQFLQKLLTNLWRLIYNNFENNLPTIVYNNFSENKQDLQIKKYKYSRTSVLKNMSPIILIISIYLSEVDNLSTNDKYYRQSQFYNNGIDTINYLILKMIPYYHHIQNSIDRTMFIRLCSDFYTVAQNPLRYPFTQKLNHICQTILNNQLQIKPLVQQQNSRYKKQQQKETFLQKIAVLDLFKITAFLQPQKQAHTLLKILINLIKVDKQISQIYTKKYQIQINSNPNKPYVLYQRSQSITTLDSIIELNKLLSLVLQLSTTSSWQYEHSQIYLNLLLLEIMNIDKLNFELIDFQPTRQVEQRLFLLVAEQNILQQTLEQNILEQTLERQQDASSVVESDINLFNFIGIIQHSKLVLTYLLVIKSGLSHSSLFYPGQQTISKQQFYQSKDSLQRVLSQIFNFIFSMSGVLLRSRLFWKDLIKLYTYVANDVSHMNEFQGLTLFFEQIDQHWILNQMISCILQFMATVLEMIKKWQDMKDKMQLKSNATCISFLNKSKALLQSKSIRYMFKQTNNGAQYLIYEEKVQQEMDRLETQQRTISHIAIYN